MPTLQVAHIRQHGTDLIIVPLNKSFGSLAPAAQQAIIEELQALAQAAGVAGTVVPVWNDRGYMAFLAPLPWHPFFESLNFSMIRANINRELSW